MNVRNFKNKQEKKQTNLFESEQKINQTTEQKIDNQKIETILSVKSKQFAFDCGVFMGSISYEADTKFSLSYHKKITNNLEEFLDSVRNFILTTGNEITSNDENNLISQYGK